MRRLILKLDDIGRDSSRQVINVVLWALRYRFPVSLGAIGAQVTRIPGELVALVRIAQDAGCVEVWNHGFRHIRYDQVALDTALSDARDGDSAIRDAFGIEPAGFGFPFNASTDGVIRALRREFPQYFIFEADFPDFRLVTPEYNGYADGQPDLACFRERVAASGSVDSILLQGHPPRWTKNGFRVFSECVLHLVESRGFVCVGAREALISGRSLSGSSSAPSPLGRVVASSRILSERWEKFANDYTSTLPNFRSYFLARFNADTVKNWCQVRSELYPFRPQRVLDLGSGLGNWSLPLALSGECGNLVLNDVNPTIVRALKDGLACLPECKGVSVNSTDLLSQPEYGEHKVDFLVSANTFNYLDPVDYFCFAKTSVVHEGRMLLMLQTPAFNRLRYRLACEAMDRSMGAEVLRSEFAMLLRRHFQVFPTGVRHAFTLGDVNRLANMFDFDLDSRFAPYGEALEEGEHVYECLLFRKMANRAREIAQRREWLEECQATVGTTFGSQAFERAGISASASSVYVRYEGEWPLGGHASAGGRRGIQVIREAIEAVGKGEAVDLLSLDLIEGVPVAIWEFSRKVRTLALRCR